MSTYTVERIGGLLTVTLDHPERGNAVSGEAAAELSVVFDDASHGEEGPRAVLLRANGKHFCTGADVSGGQRQGERPVNGHMVRGLARSHHRLIESVFHCRLPVVAAVQGWAQGFGLHLALATDFVVAGQSARFKDPFTDRGFSVDSGGSWLLPRLIGLTRAKQFLYFGDTVDAAMAVEWGLIHDVVGDDALDTSARALAERLLARPTQALSATKRLLHDSSRHDLAEAMHAESMAVELTIRSDDFKEGMGAFFKKRPPEFTGT